ncbi:hypothetical protein BD560DRAFT_422404 [Blakeslea trispora]|nr:hypothetical protein BD560DRAFT_422404 [Blakeslea trispora]
MQGHEQHQIRDHSASMRRDPLRMYFVMSMLIPLVAIRYLMSPANNESNKIQSDEASSSEMERTCKHEQRREDTNRRKAQALMLEGTSSSTKKRFGNLQKHRP